MVEEADTRAAAERTHPAAVDAVQHTHHRVPVGAAAVSEAVDVRLRDTPWVVQFPAVDREARLVVVTSLEITEDI